MKKPWSRQSQVQQHEPSPARSRSDIRSMKDRISGPIPISSPIDAGIPMAKETRNNIAEDDIPSLTVDNDTKPHTPVGNISDDQRDTSTMCPPEVSQQHVKIAQQYEDDEATAEYGDVVFTRLATPSSGARPRQLSKNVRMSYFSADSTTNGHKEPQKKKSTLRGAIGRLFGRRKKTVSQASTWETGSTRPTPDPSHPQADVADEYATQPIDAAKPEHKRSVSMPLSEKDRALRSHSIGLKDRIAIESARDSLRAESNFSRRRPGTQSLRRSNRRSDELFGLTPRPASIDGKLPKVHLHIEDPNNIGKAISSDEILKSFKRRSRSLTALALAGSEHTVDRRRSGEIRYWRASYDPEYKSPVSSAHPEQDDEEHTIEGVEEYMEEVPKAPLEPFPFSDAGLAGMKITAAASLETRISRLEDRTEYLWSHFEGTKRYLKDLRAEQMSLGSLEPMDKFLNAKSPRSQKREYYQEGNIEGVSGLSGASAETPLQDAQSLIAEAGSDKSRAKKRAELAPPVPSLPSPRVDKWKANVRPDSTATIRGVSSLPSLSQDTPDPLTIEHYITLIALLETERSAREALEAKVKTLDHQVSIMRNHPAEATIANGFGHSKLSFGGSAFDDDSEESEPERSRARCNHAYEEDDEYSDSYATPHELDTTDDEVMGYKKSDRTLSLSQMTMHGSKKRPKVAHDPLPQK